MPNFSTDGRPKRNLYEYVREYLRDEARELGPNTSLASVRELCTMLGVNQSTVNRALRDLEADGVVRTVPRKGIFVADRQLGKVELLSINSRPGYLGLISERFLAGMQDAVADKTVVSGTTIQIPPFPAPEEYAQQLRSRNVRGLIVSGHDYQDFPLSLDETNFLYQLSLLIPFVLVGKPHGSLNLDCVYTDARPELLTWMQQQYDNGARHFGYLEPPRETVIYRERQEAFRQFHLDHNITWNPQLVPPSDLSLGYAQCERTKIVTILEAKPRPDALIVQYPSAAYMGVLEAIRRGREPGEDLAILCLGDAEPALPAIAPYVTQVRVYEERAGNRGMQLLQERLEGDKSPPRVIRLDAEMTPPAEMAESDVLRLPPMTN